MKRILTFTMVAALVTIFLASCSKRDHWDDGGYNDDESGITDYISEVNSPYSVIYMDYDGQYALVKSMEKDDYYWPRQDDVIIGDFTVGGTRTLYNKSAGFNVRLQVYDFFAYRKDAVNAQIRREDNEGYAKSFKNSPIKIQRRVGATAPVIK